MKSTLIYLLAPVNINAWVESPRVYEKSFDKNPDAAYKRVYKALEGNGFKVLYERGLNDRQ
jgi:hypothetical protein